MRLKPLAIALEEDCPYADITTELLKISGPGRLRFIAREAAIISGTARLREFFVQNFLEVPCCQAPGAVISPGATILEAVGELKTLLKMWRISQTYLTVLCAIATQTRQIVDTATRVNPAVEIVVATRKAHPGLRLEEIEAVEDGGAVYHRNSLSDTILITQNHLRLLDKLPAEVKSFHHKIEIEPRDEEEAYECARFADIVLLDHFTPGKLQSIAARLKTINPSLKVGVAGGVNAGTVGEFAGLVDIIVLSSVLYAAPLDFTCKIERI